MYTHGFLQRKFIYPSLLLLFLLMLFWRFALANAAEPSGAELWPATTAESSGETPLSFGHREGDFIDAADRFNEMAGNVGVRTGNRFIGSRDTLEARLRREEEAFALFGLSGGNSVSGYYNDHLERERDRDRLNDLNDARYHQERRQLSKRRNLETDIYRDNRRQLETRLSGATRSSPEYARLERELNDLDRRHAERERSYERDFRNMDADYSIARW